jgi:gliding motility-associated-like protein
MRMLPKYLLFLFSLTFFCQNIDAQHEANVWYFGRFLGLDFNSGVPVPLNDGALNTTEGVATISNSNGNLLFYTDGTRVWNRLHQVMPNGTGLFGNVSSTQSAVIVPKINDPSRFYVFTVDAVSGPKGLCYSIVNMNLDNGNGDVEVKNISLQSNVVEKITAVKHCNNRDIWIVAHGSSNDIYYSFLVTSAGIATAPIISHSGTILTGVTPPSVFDSSSLGYLKASPDGKRIAAAHWTMNADVSNFNNATGAVSNTISLFQPGDPHYLVYGIEFSPDSKLVYTTAFYTDPINAQKKNVLFQYDVSLSTPALVISSKQLISQSSDPIQVYAALQIGPDNKMYMAKNIYKHIACINNPNVYGSGCNFVTNAIQWTGNTQESSFGLPTFIQSYFYPVDSFSYTTSCDLNVNFSYTPLPDVISVQWNFGDPSTGINNSSVLNSPAHIFSTAGTYNVQLIKFTNCGPDTIKRQVITNGLSVYLGADTTVCNGNSLLLSAAASGSSNNFLWQDGSVNPSFLATASGQYWVQVSNSLGCSKRDTINVTFKQLPVFNLGADTQICAGDSLTLNATVTGAISYLWNNASATPTMKAYQAGTYWCEVNNGGCIFRDSLSITAVNPKPIVKLGNDSTLCGNGPVILNVANNNASYLWQDGSASSNFSATASGLYWVEVRNASGCIKRDSINLVFKTVPAFNLGADTSICAKDTLVLNASSSNGTSYVWNTGAVSSSIRIAQTGTYWCEVNKAGCIFRDSVSLLSIKPRPSVQLGNDTTLCEGISLVLDATYPNAGYQWQDGSQNALFTVHQAGTYRVFVSDNGCSSSDTIVVKYRMKPSFTLGPDQLICPGTAVHLQPAVDPSWQFLWQDGSTAPVYNITQEGTYHLSVSNSCGATSDDILVSRGFCKVSLPSAFTPNGDRLNDVFHVLGAETLSSLHLVIFNRWGQPVFETRDKSKGWDGRMNGKMQDPAAFVYLLQYTEAGSDEMQVLKGSFVLVR